jgi:hypothetical protein
MARNSFREVADWTMGRKSLVLGLSLLRVAGDRDRYTHRAFTETEFLIRNRRFLRSEVSRIGSAVSRATHVQQF